MFDNQERLKYVRVTNILSFGEKKLDPCVQLLMPCRIIIFPSSRVSDIVFLEACVA